MSLDVQANLSARLFGRELRLVALPGAGYFIALGHLAFAKIVIDSLRPFNEIRFLAPKVNGLGRCQPGSHWRLSSNSRISIQPDISRSQIR
jgi:hypothetical protein